MKHTSTKSIVIVLSLMSSTILVSQAAITYTVSGQGSGNLDSMIFTDNSFVWTITTTEDDPVNGQYAIASSQFLYDDGTTYTIVEITDLATMWFIENEEMFMAAPIRPGKGNILTTYDFAHAWDGVSNWTATTPTASFDQFSNVVTNSGMLSMPSGTVSSIVISGFAAVPEPSSLALSGLAIAALSLRRRRA